MRVLRRWNANFRLRNWRTFRIGFSLTFSFRERNQEKRMNLAATIWRRPRLPRAALVDLGFTAVWRRLTGLKVVAADAARRMRNITRAASMNRQRAKTNFY